MSRSTWFEAGLAALMILSTGCLGTSANESSAAGAPTTPVWFGFTPSLSVPPGTAIAVQLSSGISSETASPGDPWIGYVTSPIIVGDRVAVPAGSLAGGKVTRARATERGARAELALALNTVWLDARAQNVRAETQPVITDSSRARNPLRVRQGTVLTFTTLQEIALR